MRDQQTFYSIQYENNKQIKNIELDLNLYLIVWYIISLVKSEFVDFLYFLCVHV